MQRLVAHHRRNEMKHESMNIRRVIRANRLLVEQGHKGDTLAALNELDALRVQVRQADDRGDLAMRRAHAALAALEQIHKMAGEESFEYRRIALAALAADERMLDAA